MSKNSVANDGTVYEAYKRRFFKKESVTPDKIGLFAKFVCPYYISTMSGSPIVQNGKIVGAVTHVMIGDPSRGYGIFITNMQRKMPTVIS